MPPFAQVFYLFRHLSCLLAAHDLKVSVRVLSAVECRPHVSNVNLGHTQGAWLNVRRASVQYTLTAAKAYTRMLATS